jgi:Protein of unknown function (DUF3667)
MHTITCKNCNHHFKGKFCPECGQPAKTNVISLSYLLHDIPHSVLHVDKGFFYTLKWMFKNPGKMIKDYMAGKRVLHFRPFAFVILMSTICTILIPMIEKATYTLFVYKHPRQAVSTEVLFWEKYISLLIFLMIPLLSLVTWLTFKKRPYNYWEHFTANTFLAAQLNIMLLLIKFFAFFKVLIGLGPGVKFTAFMVLFMFYYSYCFRVWMAPHKNWWSLFFSFLIMNFFLSLIYMTGFSLTGIMEAWWKF